MAVACGGLPHAEPISATQQCSHTSKMASILDRLHTAAGKLVKEGQELYVEEQVQVSCSLQCQQLPCSACSPFSSSQSSPHWLRRSCTPALKLQYAAA